MPRAKEFDPEMVLDKAMDLFWTKGYEATSIKALVDHMGINRFSLYSTFGDKHQLFLRACDRYHEKMANNGLLRAVNCHIAMAVAAIVSSRSKILRNKDCSGSRTVRNGRYQYESRCVAGRR